METREARMRSVCETDKGVTERTSGARGVTGGGKVETVRRQRWMQVNEREEGAAEKRRRGRSASNDSHR